MFNNSQFLRDGSAELITPIYYHQTLQKDTGITHAVHGDFTGTQMGEFAVSTGRWLKLIKFYWETKNFQTIACLNTFSHICSIKTLWLERQKKDLLVVLTDLGVLSILTYEEERRAFEVVLKETLPRSQRNRIVGQHLAVCSQAIMIGAIEAVKYIFALKFTSDGSISIRKQWTFSDNNLIFDMVALGTSGPNLAHCIFACLESTYVLEITRSESLFLEHRANLLISVPHRSGVFICSENYVAYHKWPSSQLNQCPIPKRLTNSKEDVIIACSAVCFGDDKLYILAQSEQGDIFKIIFLEDKSEVKEIVLEYFDTIPVASSLCIIKTTHLFAASEFGNQ
ncbi:splicing factor 3B subunit 3 [Trichonephila clavata]|uniref:Splicing factor 3B subunit 3 n=1 Tax=Trichonephila clavata TaxID=2740835 RepID=A0A8X6F9E5_TRICU|nr:splicing factor 3B subunit 3 [Trichonephila clavata]